MPDFELVSPFSPAGDHFIAARSDGTVLKLDLDGKKLWETDLNKAVPKTPKPWVADARALPLAKGVWQLPGGRFESDLGDLSDVTIHTDDTADQLNRSVSAKAFATGTDVYFAKGQYNPGSTDGDRLIAHELAHVVQQRGAPNSGPLTVSQPGDALENEADSVADSIS